jgi:hypothetical protein
LETRTVPSTFWVSNLNDGGPGSLRQAILDANGQSGADQIRFRHDVEGTITLSKTLGELNITDDLKILGPGADQLKVSGDGAVRVFYISPGTTAAISRLTITDGHAETRETILRSHGGGVLNDSGSDLTLTDVILSHNTAQGILGVADEPRHLGGAGGGGVANKGKLTVTGCTFIDNQALGVAGQVGVFAVRDYPPPLGPRFDLVKFPGLGIGGGLWNWETGTVRVTDSYFIDNRAQGGSNCLGTFAGVGQGGAIYNDNDLDVTRTLFCGNQAVGGSGTRSDIYGGPAVGGAISSGTNERLIGDKVSAVLEVSQCLFSQNQALGGTYNVAGPPVAGTVAGAGAASGGGIFVFQGEATISRSVLDHNQAIGGDGAAGQVGGIAVGGGICFINFLPGLTGGGVMGTVKDCALVGNEASGGTGGAGVTGGAGGRGGSAWGGGLAAGNLGSTKLSAPGTVTVSNTLVAGNVAQGGTGGSDTNGGNGLGGGLFNDGDETMTVARSLILLNSASGGAGSGAGSDGRGIGGGVFNNMGTFTDVLTLIALNHASSSDDNCFGC